MTNEKTLSNTSKIMTVSLVILLVAMNTKKKVINEDILTSPPYYIDNPSLSKPLIKLNPPMMELYPPPQGLNDPITPLIKLNPPMMELYPPPQGVGQSVVNNWDIEQELFNKIPTNHPIKEYADNIAFYIAYPKITVGMLSLLLTMLIVMRDRFNVLEQQFNINNQFAQQININRNLINVGNRQNALNVNRNINIINRRIDQNIDYANRRMELNKDNLEAIHRRIDELPRGGGDGGGDVGGDVGGDIGGIPPPPPDAPPPPPNAPPPPPLDFAPKKSFIKSSKQENIIEEDPNPIKKFDPSDILQGKRKLKKLDVSSLSKEMQQLLEKPTEPPQRFLTMGESFILPSYNYDITSDYSNRIKEVEGNQPSSSYESITISRPRYDNYINDLNNIIDTLTAYINELNEYNDLIKEGYSPYMYTFKCNFNSIIILFAQLADLLRLMGSIKDEQTINNIDSVKKLLKELLGLELKTPFGMTEDKKPILRMVKFVDMMKLTEAQKRFRILIEFFNVELRKIHLVYIRGRLLEKTLLLLEDNILLESYRQMLFLIDVYLELQNDMVESKNANKYIFPKTELFAKNMETIFKIMKGTANFNNLQIVDNNLVNTLTLFLYYPYDLTKLINNKYPKGLMNSYFDEQISKLQNDMNAYNIKNSLEGEYKLNIMKPIYPPTDPIKVAEKYVSSKSFLIKLSELNITEEDIYNPPTPPPTLPPDEEKEEKD